MKKYITILFLITVNNYTLPSAVQQLQTKQDIDMQKKIYEFKKKPELKQDYQQFNEILTKLLHYKKKIAPFHTELRFIREKISDLQQDTNTLQNTTIQKEEEIKKYKKTQVSILHEIETLVRIIKFLEQLLTEYEFYDFFIKQRNERLHMAHKLIKNWQNADIKKRSLEIIQELEEENNIDTIFQTFQNWENLNQITANQSTEAESIFYKDPSIGIIQQETNESKPYT